MNRRDFLKYSGILLPNIVVGAYASSAFADPENNNALPNKAKPPTVGHKFSENGHVIHFPGNTIICHVDKKSEAFMALLDAHVLLQHSDLLKFITLLPPASYHMTVFEGVVDEIRKPGYWPDDLPINATLDECNALFERKLRTFNLNCSLPFRMKPLPVEAQNTRESILLEPYDENENIKIRTLRNRLSELLHLKQKNHDKYQFHISLSYLYDWPTPTENKQFDELHKQCVEMFIKRSPIVDLQLPEFCLMDDMYEFRNQFYLQNAT